MSLHDAYARVTPWELALPGVDEGRDLVTAVMEEAAGRGADPSIPHSFVTMAAVEALAQRLEGDEGQPGGALRYGALVFHGYHFTRAGSPLYLLTVPAARSLVERAPAGEPTPPEGAGYLQFPQHLFWADAGGEAPESVDGVFWATHGSGALHAMLATGVRSDRPGLGVVPLPEAPFGDARSWLDLDARGDGRDFESTIPGSEIDRLYQFVTAGEVLKLLARFFSYLSSVPASGTDGVRPVGAQQSGTPSSILPFTRVVLPG
jgi:hypothetical protein